MDATGSSSLEGNVNHQKAKPLKRRAMEWWPLGVVTGFIVLALLGGHQENLATPDSLSYYRAAMRLAAHMGYGTGYTWWPPLYPLALSPFAWFGVSPVVYATWLGWAAFAALVLLVLSMGKQATRSGLMASALAVSVCISQAMQEIYSFTWSEALFLPLSVAAVCCWSRVVAGNPSRAAVLLSTLLAAACLLTRHVGVSLLLAMGASLLLTPRLRFADKFRTALLLSLATLPYAVWLLRTKLISGYFTGPRHPTAVGFAENTVRACDVIANWLVPHFYFIGTAGCWVVGGSLVLLCSALLFTSRMAASAPLAGANGNRLDRGPVMWVAISYVFFYLAMLIVSASTYDMDPILNRLMSPTYPFLMLLVFGTADEVGRRLQAAGRTVVLNGMRLLFALWVLQLLLAPNRVMSLFL